MDIQNPPSLLRHVCFQGIPHYRTVMPMLQTRVSAPYGQLSFIPYSPVSTLSTCSSITHRSVELMVFFMSLLLYVECALIPIFQPVMFLHSVSSSYVLDLNYHEIMSFQIEKYKSKKNTSQ